MKWEEGRTAVEQLLAARELERVSADPNAAKKLIDSAHRHLDSARKIRVSDPEGAFAALYDAARKSCAALLEVQGLRATSRGGHVAVRDAVVAQFASLPGGDALLSFDRLRRRRNDIEYPAGTRVSIPMRWTKPWSEPRVSSPMPRRSAAHFLSSNVTRRRRTPFCDALSTS